MGSLYRKGGLKNMFFKSKTVKNTSPLSKNGVKNPDFPFIKNYLLTLEKFIISDFVSSFIVLDTIILSLDSNERSFNELKMMNIIDFLCVLYFFFEVFIRCFRCLLTKRILRFFNEFYRFDSSVFKYFDFDICQN